MPRIANTPTPRTAWTVAEVATSIGVSPAWVRTLADRGELEGFRSGRRVLIPVDSPAAYVAHQRSVMVQTNPTAV